MIITYGPGNTNVAPGRQDEHRTAFVAYLAGTFTSTDLARLHICGTTERGRFVGYDYDAQVWIEVDLYGHDTALDDEGPDGRLHDTETEQELNGFREVL